MTSLIRPKILFIATIYNLLFKCGLVNGFCCICGEKPTGGCYEPQAPDNRVYMEGSNNDGEPWTCGGTSHDLLQAGPCGIAQANAFKDGNAGCECPVDDRPVKKTPPCTSCDLGEFNVLLDPQGNEKWFYFTAGALTCSQLYNYALQGFIPTSLCDTTANEMYEKGCCGNDGGNPSPPTSPPPPPPPPTLLPTRPPTRPPTTKPPTLPPTPLPTRPPTRPPTKPPTPPPTSTPPPPPAVVRYCTSNSDCSSYGLACDERQSPSVCSDYLSRAQRTRSKRLCRKGRGGSRAGC